MKKAVAIIIFAVLFVFSFTALAGDVPETLLMEDNAMVFIGVVDDYTLADGAESVNSKVSSADITPTFKIKGDVEEGKMLSFSRCDFGSIIPKDDTEYLFGYCDEVNFYIWEIEKRDGKYIKLANSEKFDMVKRFEDYINEGEFERAEEERASLGEKISLLEFLYKDAFSVSPVEKVGLRFNGKIYEIDKSEFEEISANIQITNIKNRAIEDATNTQVYDVLYIELFDENDRPINNVAITRLGEVDRYSLSMSRLMAADYEMEPDDVRILYSLLPDRALKESASYSGTPAIPAHLIVIISVIIVFVVAFAIGYTMRKKRKK